MNKIDKFPPLCADKRRDVHASPVSTYPAIMRLLSFLTEIERSLFMEANATEGTVWETSRMVNFQAGLARLILTHRPDAEIEMPQGTVLVQHFCLADGSFCLKTHLHWQGTETTQTLAVYDTPLLNWKLEASRIASAWLAGPPAESALVATSDVENSDVDRLAAAG